MKQEHRGRKMVGNIGCCIYCGDHGPSVKLTEEHVIPYSLGADTYLKKASCLKCAEITKAFELHVARRIFGHHRIHKNVQTRHPEQRPTELSTRVLIRGIEHKVNLSIKDHPHFLAMPIWDQPGLLRGVSPSADFGKIGVHLFYSIPDNIKETLKLSDGELAEIRPDSAGDANQFGRAIAKIAYCNAIASWGFDGFEHADLPKVILGENPCVPFFVGSVLRDPPSPDRNGPLHRVEMGESDWVFDQRYQIYRRFLVANIRLFATDGTPHYGMPVYTIIVGTPKIGHRAPDGALIKEDHRHKAGKNCAVVPTVSPALHLS